MDIKRFKAVDGLRGGLAVSVLLSHLIGSTIGWTDNRPFIGAYISVVYFLLCPVLFCLMHICWVVLLSIF